METVSIYCPHCHQHTAVRMGQYVTVDYHRQRTSRAAVCNELGDNKWWIGICNHCQLPVLVRNAGETVYPHPLPSPTSEDIPEELRHDLDEAKMCNSTQCHRAAAVLARRCVQKACLLKGAKESDLVKQIAELKLAGQITADLAEWATVVRWIGNDAAHPNANSVGADDAADALHLAEQFLHVLFVAPAVAKAQRTRMKK